MFDLVKQLSERNISMNGKFIEAIKKSFMDFIIIHIMRRKEGEAKREENKKIF